MTDFAGRPREIGPIEKALERDLAGMSDRIRPGRYALVEAARKLVRVLDARGDEEPASQTAKAVDTLRITMNQIAAGGEVDANVQDQLAIALGSPSAGGSAVSAPVRYPKEPRPDDVGAGGGQDRDGDGETPDAASAVHLGRGVGSRPDDGPVRVQLGDDRRPASGDGEN